MLAEQRPVNGDGAGCDIASFAPDGRPRLIEVKTTNGRERTPFQITRTELAVAEERRAEWSLMRLWNAVPDCCDKPSPTVSCPRCGPYRGRYTPR